MNVNMIHYELDKLGRMRDLYRHLLNKASDKKDEYLVNFYQKKLQSMPAKEEHLNSALVSAIKYR